MYAINLAWEQSNEILKWAIEERVHLRITIRLAREWTEAPSAFLGGEELRTLYIKKFPLPWLDSKILVGQLLPCSFRQGNKKLLFVSAILEERKVEIDGIEQDVYVLAWPEGLQQVQRRFYYRAAIPADMHLSVSIWEPVAEIGKKPETQPIETGKLIDISVGGAQVELKSADKVKLDKSYLLEVELPSPEEPILVQGQVKRIESLPGKIGYRYGIQFLALTLSPKGQESMEKLARFTNYIRSLNEQHKVEQEAQTSAS